MQEFSVSSMLALMLANRLATVSLAALIVAIMFAALNWDKVCYFTRRIWHATPLIGTVARYARQIKANNGEADADGWRAGEIALCKEYNRYYESVNKDPDYYAACQDYLSKVCERGRRLSPGWVMPLMAALLILEAVGFAYVIGPWVNRSISANNLQYLTWSVAAFLALISGFFAHIAGHQIHHNSLIKKARHWWRGTPNRDSHLGKDIDQITIDDSRKDDNATGYNKILARIKTNEKVTTSYSWITTFGATIVFVAIAAFWVRTEQLNALETELVAGYQVNTTTNASSSPFDLPAASAGVEKESREKTFEDKTAAEHRASLVTFGVLSVVYVAIQFIALWLSMVFGFAGLSSKEAYKKTSKFDNAAEMMRWMEMRRLAIQDHADHKIRLLQRIVARYDMPSNIGETTTNTAGQRDFKAYLKMNSEKLEAGIKAKAEKERQKELDDYREKLETQRQKDAIDAHYKAPESQSAMAVKVSAEVAVAPAQNAHAIDTTVAAAVREQASSETPGIKAGSFDDLRDLSDDDLLLMVEEYSIPLDQLKRIKATQLVLAKTGKFPAAKGVTA